MILIVNLLQMKLQTSTSFRAAAESAYILQLYENNNGKKLTHTTVLNWLHKIGYYELSRKKEKANDWIILLDHSIQIGNKKVFVVLGIRQSEIKFDRPLRFNDLTPLLIIAKKSWNGDLIKGELGKIKKEIGKIIYAVGDYGSDIKKGLILAGIKHIYDVTHKIAAIIKNLYKNDQRYIELIKEMAIMRQHYYQSEYGYLIPIKQREKSRFSNIKSISDYGVKLIHFLDNIINFKDIEDFTKEELEKAKEKFSWIYKHSEIVNELFKINRVICNIQKILKTKGLSKETEKGCAIILEQLTSPNEIKMQESLKEYFKEMLKSVKIKKILITSDILESAFGKYKNYISNNPMVGITNIVLSIAAFTSTLSKSIVKEALESTTISDIIDWTKKNIGVSLFKKRMIAFSSV